MSAKFECPDTASVTISSLQVGEIWYGNLTKGGRNLVLSSVSRWVRSNLDAWPQPVTWFVTWPPTGGQNLIWSSARRFVRSDLVKWPKAAEIWFGNLTTVVFKSGRLPAGGCSAPFLWAMDISDFGCHWSGSLPTIPGTIVLIWIISDYYQNDQQPRAGQYHNDQHPPADYYLNDKQPRAGQLITTLVISSHTRCRAMQKILELRPG